MSSVDQIPGKTRIYVPPKPPPPQCPPFCPPPYGTFIGFQVNGGCAVYPDQPIPFTWEVDGFVKSGEKGPDEFSVQVGLVISTPSGYQVKPLFGPTPPVPVTLKGEFFDTGPQSGTIQPPTDPSISAPLYQLGTQVLQIEIPDGITANQLLQVVPDPTISRWWNWTLPTAGSTASEDYGSTFEVSGTLTNLGSTASNDAIQLNSLVLEQTDDSGSTTSWNAPLPSGPLALDASLSANWPGFKPTWPWEDSVTLYPTGPFSRTFTYETQWSFTYASTGVPYPFAGSSPLTVTVNVGDKKKAEAWSAFGLQTTAAALLVAAGICAFFGGGPICGGLLAAAGKAEDEARKAYSAAQDPPEPDFRYRDVARTRTSEPSQSLEPLPSLGLLLDLMGRILSALEDLNQAQARLLGARIDQSEEGIQLQTEAITTTVSDLNQYMMEIPNATAAAVNELNNAPAFQQPRFNTVLSTWHREGIPSEIRTKWVESGLSSDLLANLDGAIREDIVAKGAQIGEALSLAASELAHAALEAQRVPADLFKGGAG